MKPITKNGQTVACYGVWRDDSNAQVVFEDEEYDGIWAEGADSWEEAVEKLTAYAKRIGTTVIEIAAV